MQQMGKRTQFIGHEQHGIVIIMSRRTGRRYGIIPEGEGYALYEKGKRQDWRGTRSAVMRLIELEDYI